jgi:hypothetical protein
MCSACPSAYGGGSYSPGLKKKENEKILVLKSYSIKERIQKVTEYYNKFPGYTLAIGSYDNFIAKVQQCITTTIHTTFYYPLNTTSIFVKQLPYDISYHIKEINAFLNNKKRPFNLKKTICNCNNKSIHYTSIGLVLISNLTSEDNALQDILETNCIGNTKWSGLPMYIHK